MLDTTKTEGLAYELLGSTSKGMQMKIKKQTADKQKEPNLHPEAHHHPWSSLQEDAEVEPDFCNLDQSTGADNLS